MNGILERALLFPSERRLHRIESALAELAVLAQFRSLRLKKNHGDGSHEIAGRIVPALPKAGGLHAQLPLERLRKELDQVL